jgi:hypothetical protein
MLIFQKIKMKHLLHVTGLILCVSTSAWPQQIPLAFSGSAANDLYMLLQKEDFDLKRYDTPEEAVMHAPKGTAVIIVSDSYPEVTSGISAELYKKIKRKGLKLYIEYPASFPGLEISPQVFQANLERGVVTSDVFGTKLPLMSVLGINDCYALQVKVKDPLIVLAKVAGFDKAEYGVSDVETFPLLFSVGDALLTSTKLSNFQTGRYGPHQSWKEVWEYILSRITGSEELELKTPWPSYIVPMYSPDEPLPADAKKTMVANGINWFYNGRFFIHPSWKDVWLKYQGDGTMPVGPSLAPSYPNGDGSLGILEGHYSSIYHDGSQSYRYWLRCDVQGEVAFAMAAAGRLLGKQEYKQVASNLADFVFSASKFRSGARANKDSAVFGLLGWSDTHPHVYYNDDNARAILGLIGASVYTSSSKWDQQIVENILANFRTSSKQGFQGRRLEQKNIQRSGWKYFYERDLVNPHPHFESWMWACYLWLYDKTGYQPLLEKAKTAIRLTMEAYPEKWRWTNGIQQERARMILPLAWLVRVEDTPLHRQWLDRVVTKVLENQMASGAIREELGQGAGQYGKTASNSAYGKGEAPLIFNNGDPVADMLYTSNFAFFSLNEAAQATLNPRYMEAVNELSDFLARIQVQSAKHNHLDGAWVRAFDFDRWEYWASNADHGWGAWSTLTGWIQSWIISTQVLLEERTSYWEATKNSGVDQHMEEAVRLMITP